MGSPIVGGDLISLVEIDQDLCANRYGEGPDATNLIHHSETFAWAAWEKVRGSFVGGVKANDAPPPFAGTEDADYFYRVQGDSAALQQEFVATNATDYTFSIYVRAVSCDLVVLVLFAGLGQSYVEFDLTAETATPTVAGINETPLNYAIANVGEGWYRVSVGRACNGDSTGTIAMLAAAQGDGFYAGDGVNIWGAQLEVATAGPSAYSPVIGYGRCAAALGVTGQRKCYNTLPTCQDTANYQRDKVTLRFANNQHNLPTDRYLLHSLISVKTSASRLNTSSRTRNEPLGTRASVQASFIDHPHNDRVVDLYADERLSGAAQNDGVGYNPFDRGTFWGKWRARNLYYLGRAMRVYQGVTEDADLSRLTVRNYIIEKVEGPDASGRVSITGKDPLKLADDDRAQAPLASQGRIGDSGGIDALATEINLEPASVGDLYAAAGKVAVGSELMTFTRVGDVLTITRGEEGTAAAAHSEGDSVQEVLEFSGEDVADIVYTLLTDYAGIDAAFINKTDWDAEAAQYLVFGYSRLLVEPVAVKKLIGELAEQSGFSLWWDEVAQLIRLAVVRQPGVNTLTLTDDDLIAGSVRVKDRPDARISQVWTNYGYVDPFSEDYRATLVTVDAESSGRDQYGQDAVRKIEGTWIPGQAAAEDLNNRLISRFRDMIREVEFTLPSHWADLVVMGGAVKLNTRYLQDAGGSNEVIALRVMSVRQSGDLLAVDGEELRFFNTPDPNALSVPISFDVNSLNLREAFDETYTVEPTASTDITFVVSAGVVVGSNDTATPAIVDGDWSGYTYNSITLLILGTVAGAGGKGGDPELRYSGLQNHGDAGGVALYTRTAITVDNQGVIQGGGGGGGGGDGSNTFGIYRDGGGGGGGAGRSAGLGGKKGDGTARPGEAGTLYAGGSGGRPQGSLATAGGSGGDPGLAGESTGGGNGGDPGAAVDGDSYITYTNTGTIKGSQVN